ncbi:hypothetical protein [Agriterribacter sp.]|nr:hypothetical protein [Agriterribacter sp.]HTN07238.1 hypothetical protein [Agriterribacter sp.]
MPHLPDFAGTSLLRKNLLVPQMDNACEEAGFTGVKRHFISKE